MRMNGFLSGVAINDPLVVCDLKIFVYGVEVDDLSSVKPPATIEIFYKPIPAVSEITLNLEVVK